MSADINKYYNAFLMSQLAFYHYGMEKFPYDMKYILEQQKCLISTLGEFNAKNPKNTLNIPEANCIYDSQRDQYLIIYNEKKNARRIYFSLAHELGHILMNHVFRKDEIDHFFMEGEANTFAGNFLAPPILIRETLNGGSWNAQRIARRFRISEESANRREIDYKIWIKKEPSILEDIILKKYHMSKRHFTNYYYY